MGCEQKAEKNVDKNYYCCSYDNCIEFNTGNRHCKISAILGNILNNRL